MFCVLVTNPMSNYFGCQGNQGVNPCNMVVWKFVEGIRLNFVLVSTKLIWTLVNMIAMHFYKILC